jgi:transcriptional regulator with GAF, ATPase, and Fis domain
MKDIEKTKEQLIWDIKKLRQQTDKEIQSKELELTQLSQVLETVTSTLDLNIVIEKVLNALQEIFSFNQISIYLFNSDNNSLEVNHWFGDQANTKVMELFEDYPLSIEWDEVYFIKSFLDNETLYISPITEKLLKLYSARDRQMFEWNPHKSIIMVPLQVQEKVIGVINFVNTEAAFTLNEHDIEQIERYVSQIATTINNAYLVKKANYALEQAKAKEKEINHLNKVIQASNASLDFDEVFEAILTGLKDVFDFEAIGIQLVDEENKLLNIYKVYGEMIEPKHIKQWRSLQISSESVASVSSYVFATGELALYSKITPDMPFSEIDLQIFEVMSFTGYFAIPLTVRSQRIGVISFFRPDLPFELDEQKISKISRYVTTLSNAINNSKTYNELQNSYYRIDSLLNASLELYRLKSIEEITEFTASQLILAFPKISLSMIFKTSLSNKEIVIHHNIPDREKVFFSQSFNGLINNQSKDNEDSFIARLNQISNNTTKPLNRKEGWKFFSMRSTEGLVSGKLILRGINLKTQNKNTLKLFMNQITLALENRVLVGQLVK